MKIKVLIQKIKTYQEHFNVPVDTAKIEYTV